MTLSNSRFNSFSSPHAFADTAETLKRLHADLVSTARMWAMDEVNAAIAHQLNEPLTALLLYLHEIWGEGEHLSGSETAPNSKREMVGRAFREAQRLCDIMERMGGAGEAPAAVDTAIARGREAIDWWTRKTPSGVSVTPTSPRSGHSLLTPREREVLALITGGASNKEGSRLLGISTRTFEVHRAHLMAKFKAKNAVDLFRAALSEGS
jgi:DNA-binding CsgD family transcriptional regulator